MHRNSKMDAHTLCFHPPAAREGNNVARHKGGHVLHKLPKLVADAWLDLAGCSGQSGAGAVISK